MGRNRTAVAAIDSEVNNETPLADDLQLAYYENIDKKTLQDTRACWLASYTGHHTMGWRPLIKTFIIKPQVIPTWIRRVVI